MVSCGMLQVLMTRAASQAISNQMRADCCLLFDRSGSLLLYIAVGNGIRVRLSTSTNNLPLLDCALNRDDATDSALVSAVDLVEFEMKQYNTPLHNNVFSLHFVLIIFDGPQSHCVCYEFNRNDTASTHHPIHRK